MKDDDKVWSEAEIAQNLKVSKVWVIRSMLAIKAAKNIAKSYDTAIFEQIPVYMERYGYDRLQDRQIESLRSRLLTRYVPDLVKIANGNI